MYVTGFVEVYRYRGRAAGQDSEWVYFMATSDEAAKAEFRKLTGLSVSAGEAILEGYDTDYKFWMEVCA